MPKKAKLSFRHVVLVQLIGFGALATEPALTQCRVQPGEHIGGDARYVAVSDWRTHPSSQANRFPEAPFYATSSDGNEGISHQSARRTVNGHAIASGGRLGKRKARGKGYFGTLKSNGRHGGNPAGTNGSAWLLFEFDCTYHLGPIHVWNGHYSGGVNEVLVHYSTDRSSWTQLSGDGIKGCHYFPQTRGIENDPGFVGPDFQGAAAKYVVLTIISEHDVRGSPAAFHEIDGLAFSVVEAPSRDAPPPQAYPLHRSSVPPTTLGGWEGTRRHEFNFLNQLLLHVNAQLYCVFIGDSLTHFWPIQEYFDRSDVHLVNRGISSDTAANVLNRLDADLLQLRPKYAHVWVGINDLWNAEKRATEAVSSTASAISQVAGRIRAAGIVPILCSVTPLSAGHTHKAPSRPLTDEVERAINKAVPLLNGRIKQAAKRFGGVYVDYYSAVLDESGFRLRGDYTDDGAHFNRLGFKRLAEALRTAISAHNANNSFDPSDAAAGLPARRLAVVPSVLGGWEGTRRGEFDRYNQLLLDVNARLDHVFIGDSITHFWALHRYLDRADVHLVNRGIGGDTPENILNRLEADVLQLRPRHAHIWTGINELWNAEGEALAAVPAAAEKIAQIAERVRAAGILPILCSVTPLAAAHRNVPPSRPTTEAEERAINLAVPVLNKRISEIARRVGGIYIDYYSAVLDESGTRLRNHYTDDGVHFSDIGKRKLTQVFLQTLAAYHATH